MSAALATSGPVTSGLADPVLDAQSHFRALMNAMARPGSVVDFAPALVPPAPLTPAIAALALSLADHEAPLWLDPVLAAHDDVAAYLRFHTGARIVAEPKDADFALVADFAALPPLAGFALGSDEYPDRSTTILAAVAELGTSGPLRLSGPGILGTAELAVSPWRAGLTAELSDNRALFPRGVDLVLAAPGRLAALPRSTEVREV